jgi:hypothetical protein
MEICNEMAKTAELIDWFHKGRSIVGGGILDESAWFLDAARFLKNEEGLIE